MTRSWESFCPGLSMGIKRLRTKEQLSAFPKKLAPPLCKVCQKLYVQRTYGSVNIVRAFVSQTNLLPKGATDQSARECQHRVQWENVNCKIKIAALKITMARNRLGIPFHSMSEFSEPASSPPPILGIEPEVTYEHSTPHIFICNTSAMQACYQKRISCYPGNISPTVSGVPNWRSPSADPHNLLLYYLTW